LKLIGLVSDTHVPSRAKQIPKKIYKIFQDVDLIIHAGDLTRFKVIEELESLTTVLAVRGNMDDLTVLGKLPKFRKLEICGWKIGVVHGSRSFFGFRQMENLARARGLDVLVFGHTHRPYRKWVGKILYINPGSPTVPLPPYMVKPSVAMLRITKEWVEAEVIQL